MLISHVASVTQGLVTSGRGAGVRAGDWELTLIESNDIEDDRLQPGSRTVSVDRSPRTERHLLRPHDVLVTARSQAVKVALVPPWVTRSVASSTLLIIRPVEREAGLGQYLWYYLTSAQGRSAIEGQLTSSQTVASLSAKNLGAVEVQVPSRARLNAIAELVDESERAYEAAVRAARLRRESIRDAIIAANTAHAKEHAWH